MAATIIDGKALAEKVKKRTAAAAEGLRRRPGLAVILVGDDPASRVYVNGNSAKPAKQIKEGDEIKIEYANRTVCVRVLKVPSNNISVQEASSLYEVIN